MSEIRDKRKANILNNLAKIESGTFVERDIKDLLIDLRENAPKNSFTRELGDFIAHDVRERGICHKQLDFRALALKCRSSVQSGTIQLEITALPTKTYDILYSTAIQFKDESRLLKQTGLTRKQVKQFFDTNYTLDKKTSTYNLHNRAAVGLAYSLMAELTDTLDANPIICAKEIITQLNQDIKAILKSYIPEAQYKDAVSRYGDDIMVCILCLFCDIKFILYDGSEGHFVLTEAFEAPVREPQRKRIYKSSRYYQGKYGMIMAGIIPVELNGKKLTFQTTFIETELLMGKYVDDLPQQAEDDQHPLTLVDTNVHAGRDNHGLLKIMPYSG